ncbi:MAG: hypothetical protein Q9182_006864 [Xanthomendoza sp. 2 TL-2023]
MGATITENSQAAGYRAASRAHREFSAVGGSQRTNAKDRSTSYLLFEPQQRYATFLFTRPEDTTKCYDIQSRQTATIYEKPGSCPTVPEQYGGYKPFQLSKGQAKGLAISYDTSLSIKADSGNDLPSQGCMPPSETLDQARERTQNLPGSICHQDASSLDGGMDPALSSASSHMEPKTDDDLSVQWVNKDGEGLPNVNFAARHISADTRADGTLRLEDRRLPTTDREGALSTLRAGEWVSATAIELVLSMCFVDGVRVFHGFSLLHPTIADRRARSQIILLPIHHQSHWILAKVDVESRLITMYDFLSDALIGVAEQALLHFCTPLVDDKSTWSFIAVHSPTQNNNYDCGVFLLITALHILAQLDVPSSYNCDMWRTIFEAMLGGSNQAPTYQTSEQAVEHHVNDTHSFLCLRDFARFQSQQAASTTTKLKEMTQVFQEQLDAARTRIPCLQSAEKTLQSLSDRSTSGLNILCRFRECCRSNIGGLEDTILQDIRLQSFQNTTDSDGLRQDRDDAARRLEHATQRIDEVQANIKRLGDAIGLINRTLNEDRVRMETLVYETRTAVIASRDEHTLLTDRFQSLLNGGLLGDEPSQESLHSE